MNSARIRQIIKEELNKVLKEQEDGDTKNAPARPPTKSDPRMDKMNTYKNEVVLKIIKGWLQQLTTAKQQQLFAELNKVNPRSQSGQSEVRNIVTLINAWKKQGDSFKDSELADTVISYSMGGHGEVSQALQKSGLIVPKSTRFYPSGK